MARASQEADDESGCERAAAGAAAGSVLEAALAHFDDRTTRLTPAAEADSRCHPTIEPSATVLTVVYADQVDTVLSEIVSAAELNGTGRGIAFVTPVERVGVAHFMRQEPSQE